MEIATLAATAVAALAPYVKDAVEDFAGKAGEVALSKAKQLFERLKDKFIGDGYAEGTLDKFKDNPKDYSVPLENVIKDVAGSDQEFAAEVQRLIEEIESAGPDIKVVQKIRLARDVVGAKVGEMSGGSVDVKQEIDNAQNVTGFEAGKVRGNTSKSD